MAKFSNNNLSTIKIPLEQIREESGNVRKVYDWQEIENLAKSIQTNGLLNPLTVKPGVIEPGLGKNIYELICGHRRLRALALLQKQGVDVGLVECCIRTGDTWTLQMIENIQRTDLTAQDKENAIREMLKKGLSQKEIAELLSKPISYVSDVVAGTKVREQAETAGIDTSLLKTRALAQLRSVNAEDLPGKVQELSEAGGTNAAATKILHEYKEGQAGNPEKPEQQEKYSIYGCLKIEGHFQQLALDGTYSFDGTKSRLAWLEKNIPLIQWLVYDEANKETLEDF